MASSHPNPAPDAKPRVRVYGYLTLSICALLLVATGRPTTEALQWLAGLGASKDVAPLLAHLAPALVLVLLMALAHVLTRKAPLLLRWVAYMGLGALAGFTLGFFLEVFVGAGALITAALGPLNEPGLIETGLWVLAAACLTLAATTGFVAALGSVGAAAIQVEPAAPEDLDVRGRERGMMGWSAAGMASLGVACGALALARQAEIDLRAGAIVVACLGYFISSLISLILWRGLDELQRRMVIDSYAVSGLIVTLGAFAWAAASASGALGDIDASLLFVVLTAMQLSVAVHVSAKAARSGSALEASA